MKASILMVALFLGGISLQAAVYLRADSPGGADGQTFDGTSWSKAYKTVKEAYAALANQPDTEEGRTIYAAQGIYVVAETTAAEVTVSRLHLYGGYRGDTDGDMTRDIKAYQTIFSGSSKYANMVWVRYRPVLNGMTEKSTTLTTKIIVDGKVNYPGIDGEFDSFANSAPSSTVPGLIFAAGGAGGVVNGVAFVGYGRCQDGSRGDCVQVLNGAGSVTIEDCVFAGNSGQAGIVSVGTDGTAKLEGSTTETSFVKDSLFFGNGMGYSGATVLITAKKVEVDGCTFACNGKHDGYQMMSVVYGYAAVKNCVFTHNTFAMVKNNSPTAYLLGGGSAVWENCVITNNFIAYGGLSYENKYPYNMPIFGFTTGKLSNSLVAKNRCEVNSSDGWAYALVGRNDANAKPTYEGCLFVSNTIAAASTLATSGGSYALGIVGGCAKSSGSAYSSAVITNCVFEDNFAEACAADGVTAWLSRGVMMGDNAAGSASEMDVRHCTFCGAASNGVHDVVQYGMTTKSLKVADSIFAVDGVDAYAEPFLAEDGSKVAVSACAVRNLVDELWPADIDVSEGLTYDPIPFDRIPFAQTGYTVPRPAANVPGIRATSDGAVRGAVNALSPTAENGRTLVVRRSPFSGGTVDIPVQAVAAGTAIAPVTATAAPGSTPAGWFAADDEPPYYDGNPLQIDELNDDLVLTVKFGMPKVNVTFELGEAGVFESGDTTAVVSCSVGDPFPPWPVYTANAERHIYATDELPAVVPAGGATIRAYSVTKEVREITVRPGEDLAAAYADAGRYRGVLHVAAGTYALTAPMALLPNVTVVGDSTGVAEINGNGSLYSAFASEAAGVTNVSFRNLTFRNFTRSAVSLTGTDGDRVTVSNCVFDSCNQLKELTLGVNYSGLAVWYRPIDCMDCTFTNCCRAVLVRANATVTNLFANCAFVGNSNGGLAFFSTAGGKTLVTNCVFDANTGTTYDAGSSAYPLGPGLMYLNTGSHRLDVVDTVFANTRSSGEVYPVVYLNGESSARTCFTRCAFTNNVYSGTGGKTDRSGVMFLNCKSKLISVRDCYFADNQSLASAANAASVIDLNGSLAMAVDLFNCTFERNVAVTTDSAKNRCAGTIINNGYSAIGIAHCTFADNCVTGVSASAEIRNTDSWNTAIRAVNSIFWSADESYVPFAGFGMSPAAFANCAIRNYDGTIFGEKLTVFGDGVWTADPALRQASAKGPNGVLARELTADSPYLRAGFEKVWFYEDRLYAYDKTLTGHAYKWWLALSEKESKQVQTVEGLSTSDPLAPDAWGRPRRRKHVALGALNAPSRGMLLLVR